MFFDKMPHMPEPDTLQEVACMIVMKYRQEQQIAYLAALQATEPEEKNKALNAFRHTLSPFLRKQQEQESKSMAARMDNLLRSGPVFIEARG
jgi:hypothetical protein